MYSEQTRGEDSGGKGKGKMKNGKKRAQARREGGYQGKMK